MTTVAGADIPRNLHTELDGVSALKASLAFPEQLAISPTGELVLSSRWTGSKGYIIQKLSRPRVTSGGTLQVPSADGTKLFIFNLSGRHQSTMDTRTGTTIFTFGYDKDGRLLTVTDQYNKVTTLHRDAAGLLTAISGPFGARTSVSLDANGWLASLTNPNGEITRMTHTQGGLLTQLTDPRGNASTYTYDALGRLTKDQNAEGGAHVLSRTSQDNTTTHTLTTAENRSRSYKLTLQREGNKAVQTQSLLRENVLASGLKVKIDARPDSSTKRTLPDGTTVEVKRGSEPRWGMGAPIVLERKIATPGGKQIEYVIGPKRRLGKKVNGVLQQGFLYQAGFSPVAELDGSQKVVSVFVYASRIYVPDYMIKGSKTYRIITDHVGSVRLVVDVATGAVAQRLDYDPFGRVTQDTSPGFQPFGFAGSLYDPDTGLLRFGYRDYDPAVGRWTAKDPILFQAGQSNLYTYVWNNPINLIDPSGLFSIGFSAYFGIGFGFEFHWTPGEGAAVCSEVGFGAGGGSYVGLSSSLPDSGASVSASIGAGAGTVSVSAGIGVHTQCGLQKSAEVDINGLSVDLQSGDTTLSLDGPELEDFGFKAQAKLAAKGCTRF